MQDFILAVGQWIVRDSKEENLALAEGFLSRAARGGASLCVLPEMFQTPIDLNILASRSEEPEGPTLTRMCEAARKKGLYLVAGSFCERMEDRYYNSAYVIDSEGEVLGVHRKIHLFDVYFDDLRVEESKVISPGRVPLVVQTPFCRLGVAVCYDVRFPEIFRYFEERGVEVAALPAAFSRPTGEAHWHLIMRSRAVDYQVFLAAACPGRDENAAFVTFGHSLVVDPWGEIAAEAGEGDEEIFARISLETLEGVRNRLPILKHRRKDLYGGWFDSGRENGSVT